MSHLKKVIWMNFDDMIEQIDLAEKIWTERGYTSEPAFKLTVKGYRKGKRCKVAPGLYGDFVDSGIRKDSGRPRLRDGGNDGGVIGGDGK